MLDTLEVNAYLKRLQIDTTLTTDIRSLNQLHLAHLYTIPFENLDIPLKRLISLDRDKILNKILTEQRGGFCYELNYAFCLLLQTIGFDVLLLSAKVHHGENFGAPFDHLLLLINLNHQAYIADVGFGDSFRTPIAIPGESSPLFNVIYKVKQRGSEFILYQNVDDGEDNPQYIFDLQAHHISEFEHRCVYQQTSDQSNFSRRTICSIATPGGRITLANDRLIRTEYGVRTERNIEDKYEYRKLLADYFAINLPKETDLKPLLAYKRKQQ